MCSAYKNSSITIRAIKKQHTRKRPNLKSTVLVISLLVGWMFNAGRLKINPAAKINNSSWINKRIKKLI
jgi:hypothetical protein